VYFRYTYIEFRDCANAASLSSISGDVRPRVKAKAVTQSLLPHYIAFVLEPTVGDLTRCIRIKARCDVCFHQVTVRTIDRVMSRYKRRAWLLAQSAQDADISAVQGPEGNTRTSTLHMAHGPPCKSNRVWQMRPISGESFTDWTLMLGSHLGDANTEQ
jgi:hypothetical protein